MKRHIWEIRERSAEEWMEERGKGWRQSGRKRGNVCRKITPWISERDSRTDWKKKQQENTRSGLSRLEKLKPHRDYRQKYRQTDKLILSGSVNLCTTSWSMIPRWHIFTSQPSPQLPCVVLWTIQTLHPTLHMCLRGDVTWRAAGHVPVVGSFLFLTLCSLCLAVVPLWNASSPVHAAVLHMPARTPMPNWTSCTVTLVYCEEYYCYNTYYYWKEEFIHCQ